MKQIVNVVVYYANEEEVITYAKALRQQSVASNTALIIVVNKEGQIAIDDFKKRLDEIELDILLLDPKENLGYMNGFIYGYNQYRKLTKVAPNWVVMSNTDIEFRNNSFFEHLLQATYEDDIWCIAPSVYSPSKDSYDNPQYTERYTREKMNRLIYIFERPTLAYIYIKIANLKAKYSKKAKRDSQFVYSAHGCFFVMRGEFTEVLRYKKYGALMYSEEAYIAEIIRAYGKKCFYNSAIEVIHNESTVTGKLDIRKKSAYFADSLKVIREEFFTKE